MYTIQSLAAPIGRLLLSLMFLISGFNKIANYSGTQGFMESAGVPGALLPLVIALEILGSLALIAGWHGRLVAFLLAGFTLLAALIFHTEFGNQTQMLFFMKNIAIAGGFLMIVARGPGPYSLDERQGR